MLHNLYVDLIVMSCHADITLNGKGLKIFTWSKTDVCLKGRNNPSQHTSRTQLKIRENSRPKGGMVVLLGTHFADF